MKLYIYLLLLTLCISTHSFSQTESKIQDSVNIEKYIDKKINDAIDLYQKYNYKKALAITKNCIKISDSIQNDTLLGRSYILNGIIDSYLNKKASAIKNHKKAVAIFTKTKNFKMLGIASHNIAFAYSKEDENIDSSIVYYQKALKNYEHIGNTDKMALTATNLGKVYLQTNVLENAEKLLKKGIQLAKIHNRNRVLSRAHVAYARLQMKKSNSDKALRHFNLAEKIAKKQNYEKDLVDIYKFKSIILEKLGNIKEAHTNLRKYDTYFKKMHAIEKSRLIQEASVKFEVKENKALLERKKTENTAKENKLKKSKQIIFFTAILFFITVIASFLLYKNNKLKLENNKLLENKNEELKYLQLQTELDFLKTQIQPHFFFNTLSNLETLITQKSNKAEEVVLKLSELMQYTLYAANNKNVTLFEEINNIQNYLELESLRYPKKIFSSVDIEGKIDGVLIPHLLYTPFIENCFKHSNVNEEEFQLSISFKNENSTHIVFTAKNSFKNPIDNQNTKGIGIESMERRLQLIYKDNYKLKINTDYNIHTVYLKTPIEFEENNG